MNCIRRLKPALPAWQWVILGLLLIVAVDTILATAIWLLENFFFSSDLSRHRFHFWLQTFTGNWSDPGQATYSSSSFIFSFIASTALILNFGPL